ncbi:VOC family protein, partial [Streptomyces sp. 2MCAF27]
PWNTRDVEVITPENARIVFTAAKPFDPAGQEARNLAAIGITPPGDGDDHGDGHGDNEEHA